MKKKQLINEIMGVPKAIDIWVNYLSSIVILGVSEIIKEDKWMAGEGDFRGEKFDYYEMSKTYSGKEVEEMVIGMSEVNDLGELLKSKFFTDFPLYKPEVTIKTTFIPDEIEALEQTEDRVNAMHSYDVDKIKVGGLGKKKIYTNNKFSFDIYLPYSYIENHDGEHVKKLYNSIIPSVAHELVHSYQQFRQMDSGMEPGYGRETVLNAVQQLMKYQQTPSWNEFLHLVYLHLSFEINARVTELYYHMKNKGVKTKEEALKVLKNSPSWKDYVLLKNFDTETFIDEFQAELGGDPLFDMLDELFRKFMASKGKEVPSTKLPKSNEEWFNKLINRWDDMIQDAQKKITDMGIDVPIMEKVPQRAKNNPKDFFRFFEKRFHKKAEQYRRKLTRVVTLVLQEAEENVKLTEK
jgi:hypothetical protein